MVYFYVFTRYVPGKHLSVNYTARELRKNDKPHNYEHKVRYNDVPYLLIHVCWCGE